MAAENPKYPSSVESKQAETPAMTDAEAADLQRKIIERLLTPSIDVSNDQDTDNTNKRE